MCGTIRCERRSDFPRPEGPFDAQLSASAAAKASAAESLGAFVDEAIFTRMKLRKEYGQIISGGNKRPPDL
jgi:hypothetical protein